MKIFVRLLIVLILFIIVINIACSNNELLNIKSIYPSIFGNYLIIDVVPTTKILNNKVYTIGLYKNLILKDKTTIFWNEPELEMKIEKQLVYRITREENIAYSTYGSGSKLKKLYSIKIIE